jgi:hypothetical protein
MQVFKAAGFTPGAANDEMQGRVSVLRQMTQPTINQLVANNAVYGIRTSNFGGALGVGMRTSSHIPPNTDILMGFGTFMPSAAHFGPLGMAENYGNITVGGADFDVIFDGRPIADELLAINEQTAALRKVNAAWINHSCRRNVAGYWVEEPTSGLSYMMYHTTRFIYPGEPLVSNYNVGVKPSHRFFKRYADIAAAGTPPADIVRCACNSGQDGRCPNDFAFDRRSVEPALAV